MIYHQCGGGTYREGKLIKKKNNIKKKQTNKQKEKSLRAYAL